MSRLCLALAALGAAALCRGANPHPDLGGYQPVSDVVERSQFVFDIDAINTAASAGDWTTAKEIYTKGRFSCKFALRPRNRGRSLQSFVSADAASSQLQGQAFYDSFTGGAGPSADLGSIPGSGRLSLGATFWDDFVLAALDGTGDFAGKSDGFRKVAIQKGVLGIATMHAAHQLEGAISELSQGKTADEDGAPHDLDKAWAIFHGSLDGGAMSAWELTKQCDLDFAYDSSNGRRADALEGKTLVLEYFLQGLQASRDATGLTELITARNNIYRIFALTSIRAALKYAYYLTSSSYDEAYHVEAYTDFLAAAGWVEQASSGAASTVLDLLSPGKTEAQLLSNLYCEVKRALIPAYGPLGLDCDKVGTFKSIDQAVLDSCTGLPACPSDAPTIRGLTSYTADTSTAAGSNEDCLGFSLPAYTTTSLLSLPADTTTSLPSLPADTTTSLPSLPAGTTTSMPSHTDPQVTEANTATWQARTGRVALATVAISMLMAWS